MKCRDCGSEMVLKHIDFHEEDGFLRYWDNFYRCSVCGCECRALVNFWLREVPFECFVDWKK